MPNLRENIIKGIYKYIQKPRPHLKILTLLNFASGGVGNGILLPKQKDLN